MKQYQSILYLLWFATINFCLLHGAEEKPFPGRQLNKSHKEFSASEKSAFECTKKAESKLSLILPEKTFRGHKTEYIVNIQTQFDDSDLSSDNDSITQKPRKCWFANDATLTRPPRAPSKKASQQKAVRNNDSYGSPSQTSEEY